MHPRFATYRCFDNRIMREAHGSFARFFDRENARPANRPSLVAVESSSSAWSVRPVSNAVNQRRKRASWSSGSLATASAISSTFMGRSIPVSLRRLINTALVAPALSRGTGEGWGFHLRDGGAIKHLRYEPSRLQVCYLLRPRPRSECWASPPRRPFPTRSSFHLSHTKCGLLPRRRHPGG